MRKWIILAWTVLSTGASTAQSLNVDLTGQWGQGRCEAIHHRGEFTFVGNGPSLEAYRNKHDKYGKSDAILLPGLVKDVWVRGDLSVVYIACDQAGLRIVQFDALNGVFLGEVGKDTTIGPASGIMQFGNTAYVADGKGLAIFDITDPYNPALKSRIATAGFAHDAWAINDSTVLVAADTAGLYVIRTANLLAPTKLDSISFAPAFSGSDVPASRALQVLVLDTVAYVAAGWGGMRTVSVKNPRYLKELGVWTAGVRVDVQGLWVSDHFAYLGCGEDGIFCPVNVSDPRNPTGPPYQVMTRGAASDVVVAQDTAYVADGHGGHLIVDVRDGFEPAILDSIRMGDVCYDAILSGDYAYVGAGKVGVKIFDTTVLNPGSPLIRIPQAGQYDTPGEARGIKKIGSLMYVADGSGGLSILSVSNPILPIRTGGFSAGGDTTYQVDVSGSYAILASGRDGLRIVDISGSIFEAMSPVATHGRATDVQIVGAKAYIANSTGIHVYGLSELPLSVLLVDSMPRPAGLHLDLRALEVSGDTVFAANGKYGLLLWKTSNDLIVTQDISGVCTDLSVRDKTLYISDAVNGLRIFDASSAGELHEVGYYRHRGNALGIGFSSTDGKTFLADGALGLMTFQTFIQPKIVVIPNLLNFGPVPPNYTRSLQLLIRNAGTSLLNVTNIQTITNTGQNEFKFSETHFAVPAGDSHKLTVRFEPNMLTHPFEVVGSSQISNNDPVNPNIPLSLQGKVSNLVTEEPYAEDDFTVGLWHFDEYDGVNSVTDASGNNLHGLVYGGPARQNSTRPGYGRQIVFDKTDDRVSIPSSPLMNFYNTPFTAELWFSMTSKPSGNYALVNRGIDLNQQFELALGAGDAGLIGRVWDSNGNARTLTSGSMQSFNINQWYHAALSWDGDTLRLYLNGVIMNKMRLSDQLRFQATEPLVIGAKANGTAVFHGTIDEVRLSNISREAWEYHVTRSRLQVSKSVLNFGNVLINQSRTIPFAISNPGSQPLIITGVTSTNANVTVSPNQAFTLLAGHTDTLLAKFAPVAEEILTENSILSIGSTDPTYPVYNIPLRGAGISTLQAGAYKKDPQTLGLWHLDESSGTVIHDSSGNALDGILSGYAFHELDIRKFDSGASLRFDGQNGQNGLISMKPPMGTRIAPFWGGLTAETWFNLRGLPLGKGTMLKRGSEAAFQFHLYFDSTAALVGQIANSAQNVFTVTSKSMGALKIRQWYHAALVCGTDSVRLFINGNRVDAVPFKGQMAGEQSATAMDTLSVLVGANWERTTPLYAYLDEIRLSSVARQSWEFNVNLARIELSASKLQFGKVLLGKERSLPIRVTNPGLDALVVSNASTTAPASFQIDSTHFTVPSRGSQLIQVTFRSLASGRQTAQLAFRTNDPFWPLRSVSLEGEGIVERSFEPYVSDDFTLALFHFDEDAKTDTVVLDSSSAHMKGKLGKGVTADTTGRYGRALMFSGGPALISANPALDFTRGDFTIEFWFAMSKKAGAKALLFKQDNTESATFEIALDTTQNAGVIARFKDALGEMRSLKTGGMKRLNVEQWYHVALSYGGGKMRLHLNGLPADSLAFTGSFRAVKSTDIRLGTGFAGKMDEFRISGIQRALWEFNVVPSTVAVDPTSLNFATVLVDSARVIPVWIPNQGDQDLIVIVRHGVSNAFSIPRSDTKAFILPSLSTLSTRSIPVTYRPTRIDTTDRDTISVTYRPIVADTTNQDRIALLSNDPVNRKAFVLLDGSGTKAKVKTEYVTDPHTLALYHLDQTKSDTAFDASGHRRHGFLNGDAQWTDQGIFDGAVRLNGKTDYIRVPPGSASKFDYEKQSFTVECYFRTDSVSQTLLSCGFSDSLQITRIPNYAVEIDSLGRLKVPVFESVGDGPRVNDGSWHHAAFTYNYLVPKHLDTLGTGRLYLDGELMWSKTLKKAKEPAIDQNRPLIMGASETRASDASDASNFKRYFRGMLAEVRVSDIVRESWEFKIESFGINVDATDTLMKAGESKIMQVSVPAALKAERVVFYYRAGGQTAYRSLDMEKGNNSVYKVTLPAASVTLQGLEYYFEIKSATETLTYPALDPVNNPRSISVQTAGVQAPTRFKVRQFQMFSIPLQLDATTVDSVIKDDFGPYDPYQWRLFWWHPLEPSGYIDWTGPDATHNFVLGPSRAFWLVSNTEKTFDVGPGKTVSLDSMFSVPLYTGWNLIGNPFNFPVQWQTCWLSSDSVTTPYGYEFETGIQPNQQTLEPWKGYWIYCWDPKGAILYVPPKTSGMQKSVRGRAGLDQSLAKGEWMIQLSAETKARRDFYNYAGVKNGAREGFDAYDRPDPPAVETGIDLAFDHSDWKRFAGCYAADIHGAGGRGQVWRFRVESRNSEEEIALGWKLIQTLPEDWEAYLFDLAEGTSVKLTDAQCKRYKTGKAPVETRIFKLVAGSKEFIAGESEGIPLKPVVFHLFQNYPNPFNPETVIHYSIPKNGRTELVVYNSLGQKVRTLIDADAKTGEYEVIWNGRDNSGRLLPSGVYIYRLRTPESTAVHKMILIK